MMARVIIVSPSMMMFCFASRCLCLCVSVSVSVCWCQDELLGKMGTNTQESIDTILSALEDTKQRQASATDEINNRYESTRHACA